MSDNREDLIQSLYEKATQEHNQFLTEIEKLTPREVIANAYEIATKADLLMMLEEPDFLSLPQLVYLEQMEEPLSSMYIQWINIEDSRMEELRSCTEHFVESELSQIATKQYENPKIPRIPFKISVAKPERTGGHAGPPLHLVIRCRRGDPMWSPVPRNFHRHTYLEKGLPRYDKDYATAVELGETALYNASRIRDAICLETFDTNVHPCIINATFERLIEDKQKSKDMER